MDQKNSPDFTCFRHVFMSFTCFSRVLHVFLHVFHVFDDFRKILDAFDGNPAGFAANFGRVIFDFDMFCNVFYILPTCFYMFSTCFLHVLHVSHIFTCFPVNFGRFPGARLGRKKSTRPGKMNPPPNYRRPKLRTMAPPPYYKDS